MTKAKAKETTWLVGGDEHRSGGCDSCSNEGSVAHIGYSEGSLGSYVYHCIVCISEGRTLEHYERTEFTPKLTPGAYAALKVTPPVDASPVGAAQVAGLDSEPEIVVEYSKSKSNSEGAGMQDAKVGTKNAGKAKKSVYDATETGVMRRFIADKVLDSGKVRFVPEVKDPEVSGSLYVMADLMPEGCKSVLVTIEYKED